MGVSWGQWCDRLAGELASLREGEFLNTWGPSVTRERPNGLLARSRRPEVFSAPVVRFLATEGFLLSESVPAFPSRGEPPLTDEQRAALSSAGWLMPGDDGYVAVGGDDLRVFVPQAEAPRAARLATVTYQILGVGDPALVEQDRGL